MSNALDQMREAMQAIQDGTSVAPPKPAPQPENARLVHLPADAARTIAGALRAHARTLLYGHTYPSHRDRNMAARLRIFADMIAEEPREAERGRP